MSQPRLGVFEVLVEDNGNKGKLEFVSSFPPLVYVLYRSRIIADFGELELWEWLQSPGPTLAAGDVQLSLSKSADAEPTVLISLCDDLAYALTTTERCELSLMIRADTQ